MSLPQKIERLQDINGEVQPPAGRTAVPVDLRDITRRPMQLVPTLVVDDERHAPAAESELAFDLLAKVSKALPAVMEHCEKLETELAHLKAGGRSEIDAANEAAREWQQIAGALKLQVEGLEKGLRAMKLRAEAAEMEASTAREVANQSQHAAAEAECLASLFQEKVISSFGAGSPLHNLLDTFHTKPKPVPV